MTEHPLPTLLGPTLETHKEEVGGCGEWQIDLPWVYLHGEKSVVEQKLTETILPEVVWMSAISDLLGHSTDPGGVYRHCDKCCPDTNVETAKPEHTGRETWFPPDNEYTKPLRRCPTIAVQTCP